MRVTFGMDLDRRLPLHPVSGIGAIHAGPLGMLSILETQLGLKTKTASQATRIVQYMALLGGLDTAKRFYHASYKTDPLGVARTLLDWRDDWYLAGWDGQIGGRAPARLQDMVEVEQAAAGELAPSLGERLQAVKRALETRRTQIDTITLADKIESLPPLWQDVSSNCGAEVVEQIPAAAPLAPARTDLGRIQRYLCGQNVPKGVQKLAGDGSLIIVKARSRHTSARLIAAFTRQAAGEPVDTAVMVGAYGHILDEGFAAADRPLGGMAPSSPYRPILQVLPLVLGLLWEPLSPAQLLQFLSHPVCPLRRRVSSRLAETVAAYPGIGSGAWKAAIDQVLTDEKQKHGLEPKQVQALAEAIAFWLEIPRHDPEKGAPLSALITRCRRLKAWLGVLAGSSEDPSAATLAASAHAQVSDTVAALELLKNQGTRRMTRQQVEKLIDEMSIFGTSVPDKTAECGHTLVTDSAAAFIEPRDTVLWWDFSAPPLPNRPPWFEDEIRYLEGKGACFQEIGTQLDTLAEKWKRPVMAARKRLALFLHDEDEAAHPLWLELRTVFSNWPIFKAEEQLQANTAIGWLGKQTQKLTHRPLPTIRRWWQLKDPSLLARRPRESFSSIDKLIRSPHQWVLQYKADLRPAPLLTLNLDVRFKGQLMHHLLEHFFNTHPNWRTLSGSDIDAWLKAFMPQLLAQEGALFLDAGRLVEKETFIDTARRALSRLVDAFRQAKIKTVEMEQHQEAGFQKAKLSGYIDMLLTDSKGREVILDAKWGGQKYRAEALSGNAHLQLALYSFLRKKATKAPDWPAQAFFIVETGNILTQNADIFKDALVYPSQSGEDAGDLWRRAQKTWKWRRTQLDQGLIEVPAEGTEPTPESEPPENGIAVDQSNRYDIFTILTGWEVAA